MEWLVLLLVVAAVWMFAVSRAKRKDAARSSSKAPTAQAQASTQTTVLEDRIEQREGERLVKVSFLGDGDFEQQVVGLNYHREALDDWLDYADDIDSGREVTIADLVREPDNEHDANAIAVVLLDETVGYVPAQVAERLAPQLDAFGPGVAITCPAKVRWDADSREVFGVYLDIAYRASRAARS